jgi:hypothetical protein
MAVSSATRRKPACRLFEPFVRAVEEPFATSARFCSDLAGGLRVKKVEEYLEHAAECREMARVSALAHHRQQLEEMAKTWEQLAEARGREIQKRSQA